MITRVAFGDVVRQVKDKVDPEESGLERYVAGEHMDTDDLRIRRWGTIGDGYLGPAFHMRFKPGHVLYGSRRTYLRKVAVADFEGITANTTYVLESRNPKVLLPELLPFIMQTETFHKHSIQESRGSVNPYVNFSDLAAFEFALPPMEEQRRLVEALGAIEDCKNAHDAISSAGHLFRASIVDERLRGAHLGEVTVNPTIGPFHNNWPLVSLGNLLTLSQYGLSEVASDIGKYPILRMMNLQDGYAVESEIKYIDLNAVEFKKYQLFHGDVLFNRTNSYEHVGRTGVYELSGPHVFASYLVRFRTQLDKLSPRYLAYYMNAPIGRRQVLEFATKGVSQSNVNPTNLKRLLIPLPPIAYQIETVELFRKLERAESEAKTRSEQIKGMLNKVTWGLA